MAHSIAHVGALRADAARAASERGSADLPPWADADRIANGERFFRTWCAQLTQCLMTASLPTAYASPRGARVLLTTGEMYDEPGGDDPLRRRIARTAATLTTVFNLDQRPDGGLRGGAGRVELARIRSLHDVVRTMVAAPGSAWHESWGTPIDADELMGTLLTFTTVPLRALRELGFRYDERDAEDYLHTWAVAGQILGIADDALPRTMEAALARELELRPRVLEPSLGGQRLLAALLREISDLPYFPDPLAPAFVYATAGPDVAAYLGLQPSRASWAAFCVLRAVWSLPGLQWLLVRATRAAGPTIVKRYIAAAAKAPAAHAESRRAA